MVQVPRFDAESYPGGNGYNLGNVFRAISEEEARGFSRPEQMNTPEQWVFTLIERVFADFSTQRSTSNRQTYYLYGHGPGGPPFSMFMPESHAEEIIIGAAGWYTMPDEAIAWPYGTGDVPVVDADALKAFLAQPMPLRLGMDNAVSISVTPRAVRP